jgi:hypothetical protein
MRMMTWPVLVTITPGVLRQTACQEARTSMGTQKKITCVNYERFHYKGLEGLHDCPATKDNLLHGRDDPGFFTC